MTEDISNFPVMKSECPTCPFKKDENGRERSPEIADMVRERCLTRASQICHHPALKGKKQDHLCRGARNFQLNFFYRLGVIKEPTDQAWDKSLSFLRNKI